MRVLLKKQAAFRALQCFSGNQKTGESFADHHACVGGRGHVLISCCHIGNANIRYVVNSFLAEVIGSDDSCDQPSSP